MIYAYPCRSVLCHSDCVLFYVEYPNGDRPNDGDRMPPLMSIWLGKSLEHPIPSTPMTCEWCGLCVTHLPVVRLLRPVDGLPARTHAMAA